MNIFKKSDGEGRVWPHYIIGGRLRTSTAGLILAFVALFWVNQNYQTEPPAPAIDPAQQVVPPGFVPDPNYTWVPRTNVQTREPEYTTTTPRTTTTRTTTTPPTTTSPDDPTTTSPGVPGLPTAPTTTVIDPDGPGPLSPQTFTQEPPAVAPTTVAPGA
ncbi:hypothetical protein C6A85_93130, partial [Mycobacterium sp. ITM-2017-0098]